MQELVKDLPRCREILQIIEKENVIAVDCRGVNLGKDGPLTLMQIATNLGDVYMFDIHENKELLSSESLLRSILVSTEIVKVIHSCSNSSQALIHQFGIEMRNVFDTQIADIVIEEDKGLRLALPEKLQVICNKYPEAKAVPEQKKINSKMIKSIDLWTKRPLSDDMIWIATRDVTVLLPTLYETQKRYLEDGDLLQKFKNRVEEEMFFDNSEKLLEERRQRVNQITNAIIQDMRRKYPQKIKFNDLHGLDEKRAIGLIPYEIASKTSPVIEALKSDYIHQTLEILEKQVTDEWSDVAVPWAHKFLKDFEKHPNAAKRAKASSILSKLEQAALKDISQKYNEKTPLLHMMQSDRELFRQLVLTNDNVDQFDCISMRLYWLEVENGLDIHIAKLTNMSKKYKTTTCYYNLVRMYGHGQHQMIPDHIRQKCKRFLEDLEKHFGWGFVPTRNGVVKLI